MATELDADTWLCHRLAHHLGRHPIEIVGQVFGGKTDAAERRRRLREIITTNKLSAVTVGRREGKPEDYASYFQRRYAEPLNRPNPTQLEVTL